MQFVQVLNMSVVESDKIDGIATSDDGKTLIILLSDHLDFEDEKNHLLILQEKINAYLGFIQSEQYSDIYPDKNFENIIIEIYFKHKVSDECKKFIDVVNSQIEVLNTKCTVVEN